LVSRRRPSIRSGWLAGRRQEGGTDRGLLRASAGVFSPARAPGCWAPLSLGPSSPSPVPSPSCLPAHTPSDQRARPRIQKARAYTHPTVCRPSPRADTHSPHPRQSSSGSSSRRGRSWQAGGDPNPLKGLAPPPAHAPRLLPPSQPTVQTCPLLTRSDPSFRSLFPLLPSLLDARARLWCDGGSGAPRPAERARSGPLVRRQAPLPPFSLASSDRGAEIDSSPPYRLHSPCRVHLPFRLSSPPASPHTCARSASSLRSTPRRAAPPSSLLPSRVPGRPTTSPPSTAHGRPVAATSSPVSCVLSPPIPSGEARSISRPSQAVHLPLTRWPRSLTSPNSTDRSTPFASKGLRRPAQLLVYLSLDDRHRLFLVRPSIRPHRLTSCSAPPLSFRAANPLARPPACLPARPAAPTTASLKRPSTASTRTTRNPTASRPSSSSSTGRTSSARTARSS